MSKLLYLLALVLMSLIQVSWAPFLSWRGYFLPLVLLVLLTSTLFLQMTEVLISAFAVGILLSLLGGGLVGLQSLGLVLALTAAHIVRNFLLGRKWLGFLASVIFAVFINEGILRLFLKFF